MAYKIYVKSNYFYIVDTENDKIFEGLAKEVRVRKEFVDSTDFIFENVNGFSTQQTIAFANIQNENGVAYTDVDTFVAFYEANTGNFNSGGATPQLNTDELDAVQGANNPSAINPFATIDDLGGGGTWGSITGTLSSQTDLQTALNNKQDISPLTDWIPNYGGFSVQPSGGFNRYSLQDTLCNFAIQPLVNGTSNGNYLTATLPFLAKYLQHIPVAVTVDNGTIAIGGSAFTTANSNVLTFLRPSGNWTTINPKRVNITGWYEIANNDKKLIFHGNSLFEFGASNLRIGNAVSNFVRDNLVTKRAIFDYSFVNKTTRQLRDEFPTLIAPYFKAGDVLVMWDLTNDLSSGQTPAQALVNVKSYCAQAKAMGLKVYILTCIPRNPASLNDANRVTLNNSIMADTSFCDGVIDVTTITEFSTSASYLNTTFYNVDGVHLTTAGYNLIGQRIINSITF